MRLILLNNSSDLSNLYLEDKASKMPFPFGTILDFVIESYRLSSPDQTLDVYIHSSMEEAPANPDTKVTYFTDTSELITDSEEREITCLVNAFQIPSADFSVAIDYLINHPGVVFQDTIGGFFGYLTSKEVVYGEISDGSKLEYFVQEINTSNLLEMSKHMVLYQTSLILDNVAGNKSEDSEFYGTNLIDKAEIMQSIFYGNNISIDSVFFGSTVLAPSFIHSSRIVSSEVRNSIIIGSVVRNCNVENAIIINSDIDGVDLGEGCVLPAGTKLKPYVRKI